MAKVNGRMESIVDSHFEAAKWEIGEEGVHARRLNKISSMLSYL